MTDTVIIACLMLVFIVGFSKVVGDGADAVASQISCSIDSEQCAVSTDVEQQ